jgi:transcriptional regulator with XRE-family HTH domain
MSRIPAKGQKLVPGRRAADKRARGGRRPASDVPEPSAQRGARPTARSKRGAMVDPVDAHRPNAIDLHVGARIRMRRKMQRMSQYALARDLDLTFQQVQKYERATNRVSASKLYKIAAALQAPVAYFFEGLAENSETSVGASVSPAQTAHSFLMTPEGVELAQLFPQIQRGSLRRRLLDLVRALAGSQTEGEEGDQP